MKSELKLSLQRYQLLFQNTMYRSGKYIPAGVLFLSLQGNQVVNKIDQVSEIVRQFGVGVEVRGIRQPVYQPDQPVNFPLNHKPVDLSSVSLEEEGTSGVTAGRKYRMIFFSLLERYGVKSGSCT